MNLGEWLRPGDGVVLGQACAESSLLTTAALESGVPDLTFWSGLTWEDRLRESKVVSYGALGRLSRVERLEIIPCHYGDLPALFAAGALPCDVVLVQVSPPDAEGRCSFGPGPDYVAEAIPHARTVIAHVNPRCPRVPGATVSVDRFDAVVEEDRPLLEMPAARPGEIERAIAANVAGLVADGDTIQVGVGALPVAILEALGGHRDLGIHSGMFNDGVVGLVESGVMTNARKPADTGVSVAPSALGGERLFDWLAGRDDVALRPISEVYSPAALAGCGRLTAINSALEVDLTGQAGSESAGGRRLGAIGGQTAFLRASAASGGTPIIALPSARIVERLTGPVSAARPDVDWVVTEHGAVSLRGLTEAGRRHALGSIGGP